MRKALTCLMLATSCLHAGDEDTFLEKYADPATRMDALAELIPGSRNAYFHTALAHQLAGREEEFRQVMAEWKTATERKENPIENFGYEVLENRRLLLAYQRDPEGSVEGLILKLGLKFDHTRPDAAAEAETVPTRLDSAAISLEAFEEKARKSSPPSTAYQQYRGKRLMDELAGAADFDEAKVRWFLEHIPHPEHPAVTLLVDRSLGFQPPVKFGSMTAHEGMVFQQLDALLKLRPGLLSDEAFNTAYLAKMRPGAEVDFDRDRQAHAAHLQRCRDHAMKLPPALDSLKAHVLHHHLRLQAELGRMPKEDFLAYLALPRREDDLFPKGKQDAVPIGFSSDYEDATGCPSITDERPLLNLYLDHFLGVDDDAAAAFAPFIRTERLREMQARARLLAGAATGVWGSVLAPADFKALSEEAFIRFTPGAPQVVASGAQAALTLDLKNTPDLHIRIYELDLPSHLARTGGEPEVSMDLEGLVPHHERRVEYGHAPLQRHRETIALPELAGAGAWIVEFVSGQVSARSLVRKGQLTPFIQRTGTGQTVRVLDEAGNAVAQASLKLGNETFSADAAGLITIPDAPDQAVTDGVLQVGKLAAEVALEPRTEKLDLDAAFHLEREQLLADREAKLQLRVHLTNHGHAIALERIKEPALVMKAELLGGITTERVVAQDLKLAERMEIPFQVPADLLKLTFTLRGSVDPLTGGDTVKLEETYSYSLNGALTGNGISTAFFSPIPGGHRLEIRGRNGEPLPSRRVRLQLMREGFKVDVQSNVRTDASGRVDLGALDGITMVVATGGDIASTAYEPARRNLTSRRHLQVEAGKKIVFPQEHAANAPDRSVLSLVEVLDDGPLRDHFDKLWVDDGRIHLRGLPPGDHVFTQNGMESTISVSAGTRKEDLLVSPARILPVEDGAQAFIASATVQDGQVAIRVRDHTPETSITLSGGLFSHSGWHPGDASEPFSAPLADGVMPGIAACGYLTDRRLDDEIRYIFDRRTKKVFPGTMLPRPGLLLNRWTEKDLDQDTRQGQGGGEGRAMSDSMKRKAIPSYEGDDAEGSKAQYPPVLDFLATPASVKFNVKPDASGWILLPLADFGKARFVKVQVVDRLHDEDTVILPIQDAEVPLRDRRIARPLDPAAHHLATRSAAVLTKDAEAAIENLLDAEWRAFTTLEEAHQYLYGATNDDRLREFAFLTEWPQLDEKKKLEMLSAHACHELHLFLARKDRAFFDKHVKPMLAQKPEKVFMDDLLLERDLKGYLRPYAWQRLNAAEKALLARALPEARERVARELSLRWQLEAPSPDMETQLFTQTLKGTDLAMIDSLGLARADVAGEDESAGVAYITQKMKTIVIPEIDFENVTVEEAVDFLRQKAVEFDTLELDPAKKGVNFIIRRPRPAAPTAPATDGSTLSDALAFAQDPGTIRIPQLRVRNVPLQTALQYICDAAKLRFIADDFSVTLVPVTEMGEDLFMRTFSVPTDLLQQLAGAAGGSPNSPNVPIRELLIANGISFAEGSSVTMRRNILVVRNTPSELEKIEQLTAVLRSSEALEEQTFSPGALPEIVDPFVAPAPAAAPQVDGFAAAAPADPFGGEVSGYAMRSRITPRQLFPERTRMWRESNYFRNTAATDETLIPLNRFWIDLAAWDGNGAFLSAHFNACTHNANEALMCLALLDLPFKAERPEVTVDGGSMRVKAREPMLLFYKDTKRTEKVAEESPLLVRQTYTTLAEPFRTVDGRKVENPVTGDFRPGVAYRASLVVTNPTGTGRRVDLLAQIPAGAIPLGGHPLTLSATSNLNPYGVVMKELQFYFPAPGEFATYPLHVSEDGTVLAHSEARTLRVTVDPAPHDGASWLAIAADGTPEQVLERLRTENLNTIRLDAILWRLRDKAFFTTVAGILRERLHFSAGVAAYGFLHRDAAVIRDFLENGRMIDTTGDWLDSPLLEVRPRTHRGWETYEFDPLVNARIHRFGDESRLTHPEAKAHYHAFLDQLAWKPALDSTDLLSFSAFLFLQDRIDEALVYFDRIDPASLAGRIHYDYLKCVALFHREKADEAKVIAAATLPTLPPGVWRDRYQAVVSQADEIAALAKAPVPKEEAGGKAAPQLDLAPSGDGRLVLRHRALDKASLRFFRVDLEILFSKDPFLQGGEGGNAEPAILPNATLDVPLAAGTTETGVDLPAGMKGGNVLISADSGNTRLLKVLDSGALDIRRQPLERTIQVLDTAGHPLPKTYVKVYAETRNGEINFHKDGYTDLRGKFDYLSHTAIDSSTIKRIAILTSHPDKGARIGIHER
ncbi:hypothetical protein OVA24_13400 [Luteolibacter sp. SL250]|uniref:hypothetical protein n=1 Tax=Luteolibacter sp. SL250 TaxID=2995170 RepID=UPI00227033D6|nr:hypothetical protein [Luteolibacter sp. SL250]WAC18233.1 hypothetical protein OVA24_13400 [Luteolibacter sp. SL250]